MLNKFTESVVADGVLARLDSLRWSTTHGLDIAPGDPGAERTEDAHAASALAMGSPGRFRPACNLNIAS